MNRVPLRPTFCLVALSAALALSLGGCSRNPVATFSQDLQYLSKQPGPGLVADPQSPIPDVPHPIGFKPLVAPDAPPSTGAGRDLRHVYQGRASLADVRLFYTQQLRLADWEDLRVRFSEFGEFALSANKRGEVLALRAKQEGKRTTVVVTVDAVPGGITP